MRLWDIGFVAARIAAIFIAARVIVDAAARAGTHIPEANPGI